MSIVNNKNTKINIIMPSRNAMLKLSFPDFGISQSLAKEKF